MENWQIIVLSIYGPFLGWLALSNIQQGKKIVALQTMNSNIDNKMASLGDKIDAITASMDKLSNRLDMFLKSELDALKDIAKSVKQ